MTAGNTMIEYAQILLDHSSFIKTILNVAMMFWLLSVISGSASHLSRKGGFFCWLDFLSFWFNRHNWNHAKAREHFKFSNEESSLGKCHEQEAFWERCAAEIPRMIFLRWGRHALLQSEYYSSPFLLFPSQRKWRSKNICYVIFHAPQTLLQILN